MYSGFNSFTISNISYAMKMKFTSVKLYAYRKLLLKSNFQTKQFITEY